MKTKKKWFVMAVAVILTGMVFVSCSSDDDEIDPPTPEIVASEILDSGCDSKVAESLGTSGAELSYESWIYVRQQTRATSETKVSVTLSSRFNNVNSEAEVTNFDFGEPKSEISYRQADSRKEQSYVTVTDSLLVYSLVYNNGYKLEYELMFETPEYNDGVTKQMMPYHKIEKVVNKGTTLSDMGQQTIDGKDWQCKQLTNTIEILFNGKNYEVTAKVIVRSEILEDVLLSSSKVDEGIELVSMDEKSGIGTYRSWLKIEQNWSVSGIKSFKKETLLKYWVEFPEEKSTRYGASEKFANLYSFRVENGVGETETLQGTWAADNVAIDTCHIGYYSRIILDGNVPFKLTIYFDSYEERARYQDEKLSCSFPNYGFSDPVVTWKLKRDWYLGMVYDIDVYKAEYEADYKITYKDYVYTYNDSYEIVTDVE